MQSVFKQILIYSLFYLCLVHSFLIFADVSEEKLVNKVLDSGVHVNLREPTLCEGVLTTKCGGVIEGPGIRIQAAKIVYTNKKIDGKPVHIIEAEENVILEIGEYIFVGKKLEYDFLSRTGTIFDSRTEIGPWYFGGKEITLCSDNSYTIHDGFVTTSENYRSDWQISAEKATLKDNQFLDAQNVKFRFIKIPVFWLPCFKANLNSIFDTPIQYDIRWGGKDRTRLSLTYEIFSWRRLKTFLRLDYRLDRGPGGGLETLYRSSDGKERFETINFMARDTSQDNKNERFRYRFQGIYVNTWDEERSSIDFSYDKLSDKDMATDYDDRGLELDTAGRTQLHYRKQEEQLWISNFFTRVRVNDFQSVKQELPTFEGTLKPLLLGKTGIISENQFKTSYMDYVYSKHLSHVHNYHSTRLELSNKLYRPFRPGPLVAIPEIGFLGIYYGNSPHHRPRWLVLGNFKFDLNTSLYRMNNKTKHVINPYLKYEYITFPTSSPNQHFIFDINDGWYRLNSLRVGLNQNFYLKNQNKNISRYFMADIYSYAFFDTKTIPSTVPKVYGQFIWYPMPTLRYTLDTAWDFWHNQLDHYNLQCEWTVSDDIAVSSEYRHRDAFDWRKVDKMNFILDSFHSVKELKHSSLSDRRDTLLFHIFYRFDPRWALEFESRHGWNRRFEPSYNEFEVDLLMTLRSAWNIKIVYQHKENERTDKRLAVYFSVGLTKPDKKKCNIVPYLDF